MNHIKSLSGATLTTAVALCLLFTRCGTSHNVGESTDKNAGAPGVVKSTVVLGKVGALGKSATINLQKLILTAVSTATPADTLRDTSTVSGNAQVTVQKTLVLAPLRNWTVSAKTLDAKDSVIHQGASSSFYVKPADTVDVSLNLTSRFTMYQANFNALPDSIASTAANTGKAKLNLNRLVLKVDGVIKTDSLLASGYFTGGQSINVYFDYVTPGTHTVTLEAYGVLNDFSGLLYSGVSTVTVAAGIDDTRSVSLAWMGPTTGTGNLMVIIGKVGKVTLNGGLPGSVFN
jgi:hypothetical protein